MDDILIMYKRNTTNIDDLNTFNKLTLNLKPPWGKKQKEKPTF
jgi:hypothetical protein